jgi:hypothetical protein
MEGGDRVVVHLAAGMICHGGVVVDELHQDMRLTDAGWREVGGVVGFGEADEETDRAADGTPGCLGRLCRTFRASDQDLSNFETA